MEETHIRVPQVGTVGGIDDVHIEQFPCECEEAIEDIVEGEVGPKLLFPVVE